MSIAKTYANHHANWSANILLRDMGRFQPTSLLVIVNCSTRIGLIRWTLPGCFAERQLVCFMTCCMNIIGNCQVIRQPLCGHCSALDEMLSGIWPDTIRHSSGNCSCDSSDIARMLHRTPRGMLREHCAACGLTFM